MRCLVKLHFFVDFLFDEMIQFFHYFFALSPLIGHLIAMDTPDSRYYIGTDHVGSPMAVFDSKGRLVKEMTRSPFGQIIRDTNPQMDLSIDFAGGLLDQYTHLVHLGEKHALKIYNQFAL